jgi:16S rRNA (cytidine1402-2'-O)-methyltransferase
MGRLVVVPTPIGNLEDITLRAIRELRDAILILAEDTRHARTLLRRYDIATPLLSYHQHNKRARLDLALGRLLEGDVALISNAGTPSISDPGFELITAAVHGGFEVDVLPGPSAVITAVVAAAIPAPGFLFLGFLPRRSSERRKRFGRLKPMEYALVFFESPRRLEATLGDALAVLGDRRAAAARELSKLHQEVVRGKLSEILDKFSETGARGEVTIVIAGASEEQDNQEERAREEIASRRSAGEDRRTALAAVVSAYGVSRNNAYKWWEAAPAPDAPRKP